MESNRDAHWGSFRSGNERGRGDRAVGLLFRGLLLWTSMQSAVGGFSAFGDASPHADLYEHLKHCFVDNLAYVRNETSSGELYFLSSGDALLCISVYYRVFSRCRSTCLRSYGRAGGLSIRSIVFWSHAVAFDV